MDDLRSRDSFIAVNLALTLSMKDMVESKSGCVVLEIEISRVAGVACWLDKVRHRWTFSARAVFGQFEYDVVSSSALESGAWSGRSANARQALC